MNNYNSPPLETPRATKSDWGKAFLCSGVLLLILFLLLWRLGSSFFATGGPDIKGDGMGISNVEGEGNGIGAGSGSAEGPGSETGEKGGQGPGAADAGSDTGKGPEVAPLLESKTAVTQPVPTQVQGVPDPKIKSDEPPPPPEEQKITLLSPGVKSTAASLTKGGFSGEVGGGGQILGTGDVQITLTWDNAPDVDLHVFDPSGEEIWYKHKRSRSGGYLDVDDTKFLGPENVFWPTGGAPRGKFRVDVVLYHGDTSNWKVRTRIDGVEKFYNGTLNQKAERQRVIEFTR